MFKKRKKSRKNAYKRKFKECRDMRDVIKVKNLMLNLVIDWDLRAKDFVDKPQSRLL